MHFLLKPVFIGAVFSSIAFSSLLIKPSNAEIFFVEDKDNRFSISFPDNWKKISNQKPDDRLSVAAPGKHNYALCRVRTREDRRFVIFPRKFDDAIQKVAFSNEFWDNYLGEYNLVRVDFLKDEAGLGLGHASMVEASYETFEEDIVKKRGIMFASLYHDQLYIVDCSSEASVYQKWRSSFLNIIKSLNFVKVTSERKSGHYRDFMSDPAVEVEGPKALDTYKF